MIMCGIHILNPLIQDGAYYHLAFLLTQQSVARDSPFKIAQWTTDHAKKSRFFYKEDSIPKVHLHFLR